MLLIFLTALSFAQDTNTSDETETSTETSSNSDDNANTDENKDESSKEANQSSSETPKNTTSSSETPTMSTEDQAIEAELKKAVDDAVRNAEKPAILNTEGAESLDGGLTSRQIRWLKPTRGKLPQNPYQHVDFTAYTLEWGEVQLGLNQTKIGILPRTQVGTQVALNLLGIYNVNGKINLLRAGPFDLALTGDYLTYPSNSLQAEYYGFGGYSSLRILENWSVHAGGGYANLSINGFPSLDGVSDLLLKVTNVDVKEFEEFVDINYNREQTFVNASLATDIRLNRRDSFILQGTMNRISVRSDLSANINVQGQEVDLTSFPVSDRLFQTILNPEQKQTNYVGSFAYQASFKRAYLRLGVGYSTIDWMWLLQSVDFTWRLGGKTKRRANNLEKVWERNKKANRKGNDKR